MDVFKGQNLLEFSERFQNDENCKDCLSHLKWDIGYRCRKCCHEKSQIRNDFSRTCNICSDTESPTAKTLFHSLKFGVRKAFFICFEMTTSIKSLSAQQMGVRYGVTEKTARLFMHKVRESMKSGEEFPMDGNIHLNEFVLEGRENGKVGRNYDSKKKKTVTTI